MVKSIIYTLTAITLCIGFFIFTELYIRCQFEEFHSAVQSLYDKVEDSTANREDAYAVKDMWSDKKKKLHIFIPHNDISYIDYWLNEACALIYTQNFDLALGKVEVLKEITTTLPDAYSISLENVF
jgi:hypothetical protein